VRERLALLGKTLFLVSFGFYLFLLAPAARCPLSFVMVHHRGTEGTETSHISVFSVSLW
jgi:hypothetical protein